VTEIYKVTYDVNKVTWEWSLIISYRTRTREYQR